MKSLLILITSFLIGFTSHAISVSREITPLVGSDNGFKVTLSFNNLGEIGGFAKLREILPTGTMAKEIDSKGGEFSFEDNTVKVIWMSKSANSFSLTYHIFVQQPKQNLEVSGEFNYLVGSEKKVFTISPTEIPFEETIVSATSYEDETLNTSSAQEQIRMEESAVSKEPDLDKSYSSYQASENIKYTVQIAALTSGNYKFNAAINELGKIEIKQYGVLYKYTSGLFSSKEEALSHRLKLIDAGAEGAFVVKYVDGERN